MRVYVNRHLFTQTSVDSGSLTMLGALVHRFPEPGEYLGVAERGGTARRFRLTVDEASPAMQLNIDLAELERALSASDCECKDDEARRARFVVNPNGYVVFHVSRGPGGYAVRVGRLVGEAEAPIFDSSELQPGDLFAVTLIRPGTYSVRNLTTEVKGEVAVAYPAPGKQPYRPSEPVSIECTERTLRPAKIKINAAQGQLYRLRTPSRIAIELVKPDDGPPKKAARSTRRGAPRTTRRPEPGR
jgi:hypothetical protein